MENESKNILNSRCGFGITEPLLVLPAQKDIENACEKEPFLNWKNSTILTICNKLSDNQRSTFILVSD